MTYNNSLNYSYLPFGQSNLFENRYQNVPIDVKKSIHELIRQIAKYDRLRLRLYEKGGSIKFFSLMTDILNKPVNLETPGGQRLVSLVEQDQIKTALMCIDPNIFIDIRQNNLKMPIYYICRVHEDYYVQYRLVVQDYYKSPDYQFEDDRFVKLMNMGHEIYYLRVAQFRDAVYSQLIHGNVSDKASQVDAFLYAVGRYVLGSAWHEDQMLGILAAKHFGLANFHYAIELLYLVLSGELSDIRNAVNNEMLLFFEQIHPQPGIKAFLEKLDDMDGERLSQLPVIALNLYKDLSIAFGRFLTVTVSWGFLQNPIALWRIIYGNYYRLSYVAKALDGEPGLKMAAGILEKKAEKIISELIQ